MCENLKSLFKDFDYEKYWKEWEEEHHGESKEECWGAPVGREIF